MAQLPLMATSENSLAGLIDRIIAASVFRAMRQTDTNLALYERQYGSADRSRHWTRRTPKDQA